jgi:hypothetical protein
MIAGAELWWSTRGVIMQRHYAYIVLGKKRGVVSPAQVVQIHQWVKDNSTGPLMRPKRYKAEV